MITFTNRNKLIAEFMGMELGDDKTMYFDDAENLHPPTPIDQLKYHESWDWLLPVVNKCTQIGYRDQDFDSEIYGTWEGLFDDASMFLGNHIEEVYWSVVHFIEWYAEYKREEAQEYPLTPKESYPVTKNK